MIRVLTATIIFCVGVCLGIGSMSCDKLTIHNASELIKFSNSVNNGINNYQTVYLGNVIYFSEEHSKNFKPIGSKAKPFSGTFDGQGFPIKNLKLTGELTYAGLFGYTENATIKNVVIDKSCAISSNSDDDDAYVGSVCGCCKGICYIEGCVNMADVTYTNDENIRIGGIVGECSGGCCTLKSNVNYGKVTQKSYEEEMVIMTGGVVGKVSGNVTIQECANFGDVTNNYANKKSYTGGIIGNLSSTNTNINNCISGGNISAKNNKAGVIIGETNLKPIITDCFYDTSICQGNEKCNQGNSTPYNKTNIAEVMSKITSSTHFVNTQEYTLHFKVNCISTMNLTSKIIVIPKDQEWYTSSNGEHVLFNASTINEDTTIYSWTERFNKTCSDSSPVNSSSSSSSARIPTSDPKPSENNTDIVEIKIKDMTINQEDIEQIIKTLVKCNSSSDDKCFKIAEIRYEDNSVVTIIKFENPTTASNFVEAIKDSSFNVYIESINYLSEHLRSCASSLAVVAALVCCLALF